MVEAGGEPDGERRRVNSSISQACRAVKAGAPSVNGEVCIDVQRHHCILKTGATFIAFTVSCGEAVGPPFAASQQLRGDQVILACRGGAASKGDSSR